MLDAAIGGKTGVNLAVGKNLIGSFHQPLAVLIDPAVLETLPDREYRAGLFEIIKAGVIRDASLFQFFAVRSGDILAREPEAVDRIIADAVRIKAEVVSADERESGLRRILNFGHTFGHALEAETGYTRFLHGEAVAFGMRAATHLGGMTGHLSAEDGISAENLLGRLVHDKKTIRGNVHFVVPVRIGAVEVVSGIDERMALAAIRNALS